MVIAVALACVPRAIKKAFGDRFDPRTETAKTHLAEAVTTAVEQTFTLERKPLPPPGRGVPARPE
jgi:hypothetical protein